MAVEAAKMVRAASRLVVKAVPIAIAKAAKMPVANRPCESAKTSTKIEPEHGLIPAAITAAIAPRIPESGAAMGAWLCPQCWSWT